MIRRTTASMLVATAIWGSNPHCIITGTVASDVPPVTTLMKAVRKKTIIRPTKLTVFIVATFAPARSCREHGRTRPRCRGDRYGRRIDARARLGPQLLLRRCDRHGGGPD